MGILMRSDQWREVLFLFSAIRGAMYIHTYIVYACHLEDESFLILVISNSNKVLGRLNYYINYVKYIYIYNS